MHQYNSGYYSLLTSYVIREIVTPLLCTFLIRWQIRVNFRPEKKEIACFAEDQRSYLRLS